MYKLFILCKNEKLGIDKDVVTYNDISKLVEEESNELIEALQGTDIEHMAEEAFDNIQVSNDLLDKLNIMGLDLEHAINVHNMKLIGRGWKFKKMLEVNVK